MAGYTRETWIEAQPPEIIAFSLSPANAAKVADGVTEMVKVDDGPLGVGTKFRETRVVKGKPQTVNLEIVEFDPERGYTVQCVQEGIEVLYRYELQPRDQGSHVTMRCEVRARGWRRLLTPLVAGIMAKMDGDHLDRLKMAMSA